MVYEELLQVVDDRSMWDCLYDLERRIKRIEAFNSCRNTMAEYNWVHTASDQAGTDRLFDMDDSTTYAAFMGGVFDGPNGVREHFDRFMVKCEGERGEDGIQEDLAGRIYDHTVTCMAIEVSWDAKTAVAKLETLGLETGVDDKGGYDSSWALTAYWMDYKPCEDGEWKFWHFRMMSYALCRFQMENGWYEEPRYDFYPNVAKFKHSEPQFNRLEFAKVFRGYNNKGKSFFPAECWPPNPMPYRTFTEEMNKIDNVLGRFTFDGKFNHLVDWQTDPQLEDYAWRCSFADVTAPDFWCLGDDNPEYQAIFEAQRRRAAGNV